MSRAALRRALDEFEEEEQDSKFKSAVTKKKTNKSVNRSSRRGNISKRSSVDLKKKAIRDQSRLKKSFHDLKTTCILDDVLIQKSIDHSKYNLEMLQFVSSVTSASVGRSTTSKILSNNNEKQISKQFETKEKQISKQFATKEQNSVFTDADFEEFEKSYFCNTKT